MSEKVDQKVRPFHGCYSVCVLDDGRLRLPNPVRGQLRARELETAWISPLPGAPALALCSESVWREYLQQRGGDPEAETLTRREFLAKSFPRTWGSKGRIYLPESVRNHAGIRPGGRAVILGAGDRFELWKESECELVE